MSIINAFFGLLFYWCYQLCSYFSLSVLLIALLSKVLLLPVALWMQKNAIQLVKIQPEINRVKTKFFGDEDRIAEEQSRLFKEARYNPFSSVIPIFLQIILLLGLIEVIHHPITYLFRATSEEMVVIEQFVQTQGTFDFEEPAAELNMIKILKNNMETLKDEGNFSDSDLLSQVEQFQTEFLGFSLVDLPMERGGIYLLIPFITGLSSVLLCYCQNKANVLQSQQSKRGQYFTTLFSVGLSTYLGLLVPVAVAFYWVCGNILAVIQLYGLNFFIDPKKYVDYEALESTKKKLDALESIGEKKKLFQKNPNAKREKEDYKRFFSIANKHLVFYSEGSGFYKYFRGMIEELLARSNVTVHYITSDPNDQIFKLAEEQTKIKPYYIGEKKLIVLMMKMDADVVVMTMPDLNNYHIKRSLVREDIEYIYVPHAMGSLNLVMRKGSMDHYDTVFCIAEFQKREALKTEEVYGLKKRNLVEWGYCLLDEMIADYEKSTVSMTNGKKVLIAPSWQTDNIMDLCLSEMLKNLVDSPYEVTVRPHPQYIRHNANKMEQFIQEFENFPNIYFETDFSSTESVFSSDLVITDWSTISYDFAYTTHKPVLFINTPIKIMNPEYEKLEIEPVDISLRDRIGKSISLSEIGGIETVIGQLLENAHLYETEIKNIMETEIYHLGKSSSIGARYILQYLQNKPKK